MKVSEQYTEQVIQSFDDYFFKTFENESWFETEEFESMVAHCQETLRVCPQEAAEFIHKIKSN